MAGVLILAAATQRPYSVIVDGEARIVWSHARTVGGVLASAGVGRRAGDETVPHRTARVLPGDRIFLARASDVEILGPSDAKTIASASLVPANLLASAGIKLFPADLVWVDGLLVTDPTESLTARPHRLRYEPASRASLQVDGVARSLTTAARSLAQALEQTGDHWYEADSFGADPSASLAGTSEVRQSVALSIATYGRTLLTRAVGPTVSAALLQAGVPLQGLDRASPEAQAALPGNGNISVVRVRDEVLIEQQPIPYETTFEPDPEGAIDTQKVVDPGAYGINANRVRVRKEDGIEVARQIEGEWVAREPEPRVVGYGTKIELKTLDTEYGPLQYYRVVPMYATSYSPCRLGIPECDNITASGAILKKGIAAVLVRWYRYMAGSQVYVAGYGIATIADTGGGIPGRFWIDLGYEDHDYKSWHDWVTVYFLAPVPQNVMWVLN